MSEVHKDKLITDPISGYVRRAEDWATMSSNFNKLGWFLISTGGISLASNLYESIRNRQLESTVLLTAVTGTALLGIGINAISSAKRAKELLRTEERKASRRTELTLEDKKFLKKLKIKF